METTILYPFSITSDNKSTFSQTLQLAKSLTAEVVCFTSVSEEKKLEEAYLHLLQLNGHFQTTVNKWQETEVKMRRAIKIGLFENELTQYLKETSVDLVICQPQNKKLKEAFLSKLISDKEKPIRFVTMESI